MHRGKRLISIDSDVSQFQLSLPMLLKAYFNAVSSINLDKLMDVNVTIRLLQKFTYSICHSHSSYNALDDVDPKTIYL